MKTWKKLLIQGLAAALIGVGVSARGAQSSQKQDTQIKVPQKTGAQENGPQKSAAEKSAQKKGPQAKAIADFRKLDASVLPITKKIQIGGDADWLGIGFGSVWVTVAKNNEVVRVDPARNVVQARIAVDKEPCYGIGIGVDKVWVLNCQS